jgi:hypothetical protein
VISVKDDCVIRAGAEPEIGIDRTVKEFALEPVTVAELHLIIAGVNTIADNGLCLE